MKNLQLIDIRKYRDLRAGQLSVIEQSEFPVKRVFWISDIYGTDTRGGHAHKKCEQLLVVLQGSCVVRATQQNGDSETFTLKEDNKGLWVPSLHWLDIGDFRRPTVLLVLASEAYDKDDYINKMQEFLVGSA